MGLEICTSGAAVMYALLRRGTIATCWRRRKALAEVPLSGLLKTIGVTFLKTIGVTFLIFAFFKLRAGARTWHCLFDVCVSSTGFHYGSAQGDTDVTHVY